MNNPKRIFIVGIIFMVLLLSSDISAEGPFQVVYSDPVQEPWRWQSFPQLNGLGLRCLEEGEKGAIWFGTNEGIRIYDGLTWTTYDSLWGNSIDVICKAKDGRMYAATEKGINVFDGISWQRLFPPQGKFPWPISSLIEARDGSMWAGTAWGALHLGKGSTTVYTSVDLSPFLRSMAPYVKISALPDSMVYTHPWPNGIGAKVIPEKSSDNQPKVIGAIAPGSPAETAGLQIGDRITISGQTGVEQSGQRGAKKSRLTGKPGTSIVLRVEREELNRAFEVTVVRDTIHAMYRHFWVYDVFEDSAGTIWFGLERGHILSYDQTAKWENHTEHLNIGFGPRITQTKVGPRITQTKVGPRITQTKDGKIWMVSDSGYGDISHFDGHVWKSFSLKLSGGNNINPAILETQDGTLWVGGYDGFLYALRHGVWKQYHASDDTPFPTVRIIDMLETSDGGLWFAGNLKEAVRLDYATSRWKTYKYLNFQCETPDGAQWFIHQDNFIVCRTGQKWIRYTKADGLMSHPSTLFTARDGMLWASGNHNGIAATAYFKAQKWISKQFPTLSVDIIPGAVYQTSNDNIWFGASGDRKKEANQTAGVVCFDGNTWIHYTPEKVPWYTFGIGQAKDGSIWFGGSGLHRYDEQTFTIVSEPDALVKSYINTIYTTSDGHLWMGTEAYGTYHFDGHKWNHYDVRQGLADNSVNAILQLNDGSTGVATDKGICRFDGQTWINHFLPRKLIPVDRNGLRQSSDGALWITRNMGGETIRYQPNLHAPNTTMTIFLTEIPQPGNITLAWEGVDPWEETPSTDLQFSWRLDTGKWSAFSSRKILTLTLLPVGKHIFHVKARDHDFNKDPTPAILHFTVIPPVWQQSWFVGLLIIFAGTTGLLISHIIVRTRDRNKAQRELIQAQAQLVKEAEKELHTARDMQMSLMPTEPPQIENIDIAGRCIPANHVSGDFFQYFEQNNTFRVCEEITVANIWKIKYLSGLGQPGLR